MAHFGFRGDLLKRRESRVLWPGDRPWRGFNRTDFRGGFMEVPAGSEPRGIKGMGRRRELVQFGSKAAFSPVSLGHPLRAFITSIDTLLLRLLVVGRVFPAHPAAAFQPKPIIANRF
jgi:hypothetical protein